MSRVMRRTVAALTDNMFNDVLSPGATEKYEVLSISLAQYLGPATDFFVADNQGGGAYLYLTQAHLAAGVICTLLNVGNLLIPHPDKLSISTIVAGSSFTVAVVTYVEVSPV